MSGNCRSSSFKVASIIAISFTLMSSQLMSLQAHGADAPKAAAAAVPGAPAPADKPTENAAEKPTEKTTAEKMPPAVNFQADDIWNVDIFQRDDHKVLIIQERQFTKAKKIELGVHLGIAKANPFYNTMSYGVHGDYHFSEYIGIEGFANFSSSRLSADARQIDDFLAKAGFSSVKEYQKPISFMGAAFLWSPIYGKFAFFRKRIIHFDIFGSAGLSVMKSETNHPRGRDQTHFGTLASVGMKIFLSQHWSVRLETRNNIFRSYFGAAGPASDPGVGTTLWRQSWQFTAGTSYTFGASNKAN